MMSNNVRILVVAAAGLLLGLGLPAAAQGAGPVLQDLTAEAGSGGPVIHLQATGDLDTLHYSPQPGVWVVEFSESVIAGAPATLSEPDLGIERAELERVEEFGRAVTRLTVWLQEPAQLDVEQRDGGVDLRFSSFSAEAETTAAPEPVPVPVIEASPVADPGANLYEVVPVRSGDGVEVRLHADGALEGHPFTLENPSRVVLDLPGVVNRVERHVFTVGAPVVDRVRVAQFRAVPEPITRLVVDLKEGADYGLEAVDDGAVLWVGATEVDARPAVVTAGRVISNDSGPIVVTEPARPEPVADPVVTAPAVEASATVDPEPAPQAVHSQTSPPEPADLRAPAGEERSPWVADRSQLIERAAAAQELDMGRATDEFAVTEIQTQEQQFSGEPITMRLKDADIRDVLRTFSALTNLNIVVDPSVSGSVTVELREVPWDQALDLILKINGLDYVLENNVLRVAPIAKLAQEKQAMVRFQEEQEKALPLKTVFKRLSYAKAQEAAGLMRGDSYLLSQRGSVVVDSRTNTLIIRDTVERVEAILRLVEMLDQPTPQVVIEGRIVETTRDFSHELGITWGFTSALDQEHGTDTGLNFPNEINGSGRVNLVRGATNNLAFTFGDILGSFNLDFILGAAESDGLVKIVSTPRVTTQNLQRATIRSGLQIPIQTVANNTVTVQYQDATLQLDVLPQITAEGTVNLDINIKKQEPAVGAAVTGGQNTPIFTRDAQTQLLVRDGGTTVIAGIYQINDQTNENRVPGLSKIPVIKHLFKNKGVFKRHDELLIFITPRIVKY